ncbi:MAG: 3-phosphoshikimate 1-carboxyvinyltransferase [Pseudomonadota bacterium]|nr:3-phosphoshikimate 1-carboxyvinyltransferase [Pseudomonadota bacterium]
MSKTFVDNTYVVQPGGCLQGPVQVPGDKSISHRSIMLGALADGRSQVTGFLDGLDCLATRDAFRAMGVSIEGPKDRSVTIHGVGLAGLREASGALDLGNSGTSMRLLSGLLSAQRFDSELAGDESLNRRPMRRVIEPLQLMGAQIESSEAGTAPLKIRGGQTLRGIEYRLPVASAQVKSAIILAGLYATGRTIVYEPAPTRDHTERMLQSLGYPLIVESGRVEIRSGGQLTGRPIEVPADISSAAFWMVGASIAPDSDIVLRKVGINPTRTGIIDILRLMGGDIEVQRLPDMGAEPVADIRVRSANLKGIEIPVELVPLAIDEFPVIFVAAACAEGETRLTGAEELRVKESDRLSVMADALNVVGIAAQTTPDGICIRGGRMMGGEIDSHGDHRVAMAMAMAGLRARSPIRIKQCRNVETSFPGFVEIAQRTGLSIEVADD